MSEGPITASPSATAHRRWFRFAFNLRTLLAVITLAGVWLGWWCHRAREQKASVEAITRLGGWTYYDFQLVSNRNSPGTRFSPGAASSVPKWVLDRLGYDYFHNVVDVNLVYNNDSGKRLENENLTDEALAHLAGFPKLRKLALHGTQASDDGLKHVGNLRGLEELFMWDAAAVTDEGISHLSGLKRLKYLHCSNSQITDESLRVLATLPSLTGISAQENRFTDKGLFYVQDMVRLKDLVVGIAGPHTGPAHSGTPPRKPITDAGLVHLKGLVNLTLLDLQTTEVTSEGLKHLEGLKNLKDLWISGSAVTDTSEFQKALPNCKITK